jgi:hypothetical protein
VPARYRYAVCHEEPSCGADIHARLWRVCERDSCFSLVCAEFLSTITTAVQEDLDIFSPAYAEAYAINLKSYAKQYAVYLREAADAKREAEEAAPQVVDPAAPKSKLVSAPSEPARWYRPVPCLPKAKAATKVAKVPNDDYVFCFDPPASSDGAPFYQGTVRVRFADQEAPEEKYFMVLSNYGVRFGKKGAMAKEPIASYRCYTVESAEDTPLIVTLTHPSNPATTSTST